MKNSLMREDRQQIWAGRRISEFKYTSIEVIWRTEIKIKIMKKNGQPQKLGDNIKYIDVHVMGISEMRREKKRKEKYLKKEWLKFSQIWFKTWQKAQSIPSGINPKRFRSRHIIVNLLRIQGKKKILDVARKKCLSHKR